MNWLDFGDLDLIFKITAVEKLKIHCVCGGGGGGGGGWVVLVGGTSVSVFPENTVTSCRFCLLWLKYLSG